MKKELCAMWTRALQLSLQYLPLRNTGSESFPYHLIGLSSISSSAHIIPYVGKTLSLVFHLYRFYLSVIQALPFLYLPMRFLVPLGISSIYFLTIICHFYFMTIPIIYYFKEILVFLTKYQTLKTLLRVSRVRTWFLGRASTSATIMATFWNSQGSRCLKKHWSWLTLRYDL